MKSVVSGSRSLVFSATSVGSMLETNRACNPGFTYGWRASYTMTGPRSDPPIPMFTTVVIGLPVTPTHSPLRTLSAKAYTLASTLCTSGMTSVPSTTRLDPSGVRSAVCSTARSSVTLMCSPESMASRRSTKPTWSARSTRALRMSALIKFLDRSTYRSPAVNVNDFARDGSAANQPRRSGCKDS